jgi:secreted Zn-dependent insulinase-like peptidase
VEAFLAGFEERMAALLPEEFARHKVALIASKLSRDRNLGDETDRHWATISTGRTDFWAREEEVAALEGLELQHVQVRQWRCHEVGALQAASSAA